MGLRNAQYHAIMREYEKRQLKSHDIQTARYEEVLTFSWLHSSQYILFPFFLSSTERSSSTEIPLPFLP